MVLSYYYYGTLSPKSIPIHPKTTPHGTRTPGTDRPTDRRGKVRPGSQAQTGTGPGTDSVLYGRRHKPQTTDHLTHLAHTSLTQRT
jgi:hypothetical protein